MTATGIEVGPNPLKMSGKACVHDMVRRVLRPGMTAIDVGAAEGTVCETMRACVGPTGSVLAIEPRPTDIPDVQRIYGAVGKTTGMQSLYLPAQDVPDLPLTLASFFPGNVPGGAARFVSVPTHRLDDLVSYADLVKVDVQGAELDVLDGAPRLLQACPAWILEIWPHGLRSAKRSLADVFAVLEGAGLTPQDSDGAPVPREWAAAWLFQMRTQGDCVNWLCTRV